MKLEGKGQLCSITGGTVGTLYHRMFGETHKQGTDEDILENPEQTSIPQKLCEGAEGSSSRLLQSVDLWEFSTGSTLLLIIKFSKHLLFSHFYLLLFKEKLKYL